MKKLCLQIIGLVISLVFFSVSLLFGASKVPVIMVDVASKPQNDFLQNSEIGIGQLFDSDVLQDSSQTSSEVLSELSSLSDSHSQSNSNSTPNSSEIINSKPPEDPDSLFPPSSESSKPSSSQSSSSSSSSSSESSSLPSSSNSDSSVTPPPAVDEDFINILAGAVQAEIIGTNSVPMVKRYEAYKAQAVASHSYMEYYKARNGKYPGMPYIKPHTKTIELVREVASKLIYYDGKVINASYHAYSGGHTQSSEYVWGGVVPYLRGVPSKYDDYIRTYTLSVSQTSTLLKSKLGITSSGDPKTWFNLNEATKTDGGFVHNIKVCNVMTTGRKLRESVFGAGNLKSPKITSIDVVGENFNFTTNGYGHGVGMSQGGAIGYSENENYSYEQILTKYYTGVVVK